MDVGFLSSTCKQEEKEKQQGKEREYMASLLDIFTYLFIYLFIVPIASTCED